MFRIESPSGNIAKRETREEIMTLWDAMVGDSCVIEGDWVEDEEGEVITKL